MLKEFEELLLDNTLFKVQNQALEDRNPKWKEWWQTVQMFIEEHIQDNMELARSEEQSYQLELQAYCIAFPNFKYELLTFVYEEIETSSKVRVTRSMVQLVAIAKLVNPLRGGACLDIISLRI
jgi:DNA-binding transcriptional regulator PaaX